VPGQRYGLARQRQPDRLQHPGHQPAAARVAGGQLRNLLGEPAGRALDQVAEDPAYPKPDFLSPAPSAGSASLRS
jgi:hypothetical protein